MEVILLENISKLGKLGETVNVKSGFGRNYLIPQGKAVFATAANTAEFETRRAELETAAATQLEAAQQRADAIDDLDRIAISAVAGEEGKLFGSVGTRDITEALMGLGCEVDKSEVRLPDGPLRELGEYEIAIQVHGDIIAMVAVEVVAEEATD
jgi:large subunit ribosomal protein L9